jgi:hypothetical protein
LESICKVLDCQPGDILEFVEGWYIFLKMVLILKINCPLNLMF